MTTFNLETTIPSGNFHKRQTGLWGQLLASAEIERKLARVEPLFKELHGRNMSRTAFFTKCREIARDGKADVGGYLQYMTQDVAGIMLRVMHTEIGKTVRYNRKVKNVVLKRTNVVFVVGGETFDTTDFTKKVGGFALDAKGFAFEDSKIKKLYDALAVRSYPVTKATLMKESGIQTDAHFHVTMRDLRTKGFTINTLRGKHVSLSPKYQLVG